MEAKPKPAATAALPSGVIARGTRERWHTAPLGSYYKLSRAGGSLPVSLSTGRSHVSRRLMRRSTPLRCAISIGRAQQLMMLMPHSHAASVVRCSGCR